MKYFTVIASNYSAQALAMATSLKQQSPDASIDVWLIDKTDTRLVDEYCNAIPISKAIAAADFNVLALKYSILELSTAVKPYIFRHYLFNEQLENVVYLDPDLYFCQAIEPIVQNGLKQHDYLLTPHATTPLPVDNKHPNDLDLLKSGTFNLGFIAIRNTASSRDFISWWLAHLKENCWSNPTTGVFTDQKWINLAITYWPNYKVLNEPGLNVAYWNLHERAISKQANKYLINNTPLYFFHFSGFVPGDLKLSKHETRIGIIKPDSALYDLAVAYKKQLYKFGYEENIRHKVTLLKFNNGATPDPVITIAAKDFIAFDQEFDLEDFYSWLTVGENFFDIRYVQYFLKYRPDVRNHFESLEKLDEEHVIKWLVDGGADQCGLDKITLIEIGIYKPPTVAYLGYANAMSGVGDATRGNIASLKAKRFPVAISDISSDTIFDHEVGNEFDNATTDSATITIAHVNADMLPDVYKKSKPLFAKYVIAYMAWETASFPRHWEDRSQYCDEIWVPSNFAKLAIESVIQAPVYVIPHALTLPSKFLLSSDGSDRNKPLRPFTFLVSFDACSDVERKNPQAAIKAFKMAFGKNDNVRLILKISNSDRCTKSISSLHQLINDKDNIDLISKNLSKDEYFDLMKRADVYVSLHRGEGFGLNIQQAMAMGKPVIVTNYGGNVDFCLEENSLLIDYSIIPINVAESQYPYYTMWAEPDVQQASQAMRKLYLDRMLCLKLGRNASEYIKKHHSYDKIGSVMQNRLLRITQRIDFLENRFNIHENTRSNEVGYLSPDLVVTKIFDAILDRTPSSEDLKFYKNILAVYGPERVFRDVLISNEGTHKKKLPLYVRKLLKAFWLPSSAT